MKTLNCNRVNGNIITENTAKIVFYGKDDSIGNIYNASRVEVNGVLDHFSIDGVDVEKSRAIDFYNALWWTFLKVNERLVKEITSYDNYEDGLPQGVANSTARVFELVKKYGVNGLGSNCKEFLIYLREKRQTEKNETLFDQYKRKAEYLVRTNDSEEKDIILEQAREQGGIELVRLTSLMYDKKIKAITEALYNMQIKDIKKDIDMKESVNNEDEVRVVLE